MTKLSMTLLAALMLFVLAPSVAGAESKGKGPQKSAAKGTSRAPAPASVRAVSPTEAPRVVPTAAAHIAAPVVQPTTQPANVAPPAGASSAMGSSGSSG